MSGKAKHNVVSYFGLAAWLIYGLLGVRRYWTMAACGGLVVMLPIVASEMRTRSVKIIDCTSLGFFLLAIVALFTAGEWYFNRYEALFGWGLFALVAWITMIIGVPFRLQYAREKAPQALWDNPLLRRVHFRVSVAWAIIFTLDTILSAIALGVGHHLLLVGIIPGATMVIGFALTVLYPAYYERELGVPMMQGPPSLHDGTEASRTGLAT
jgi:hypothetical protein